MSNLLFFREIKGEERSEKGKRGGRETPDTKPKGVHLPAAFT